MTYKYKDDVKRVLFEQQRVEQNPNVLNTAFNMRDELNEVYQKAKAFDEYHKIIRDYITGEDDDWDKTWDPLTGVYYDYESEESE